MKHKYKALKYDVGKKNQVRIKWLEIANLHDLGREPWKHHFRQGKPLPGYETKYFGILKLMRICSYPDLFSITSTHFHIEISGVEIEIQDYTNCIDISS